MVKMTITLLFLISEFLVVVNIPLIYLVLKTFPVDMMIAVKLGIHIVYFYEIQT